MRRNTQICRNKDVLNEIVPNDPFHGSCAAGMDYNLSVVLKRRLIFEEQQTWLFYKKYASENEEPEIME